MSISLETVKLLMVGTSTAAAGNEVATALNKGLAAFDSSGFFIPAAIIATSTSQTTDFGALEVDDLVVVIPASAGNSHFVEVATAGTLGEAAVVGSLYVVLRAKAAVPNSDVKF